jgi:hypothetical protein
LLKSLLRRWRMSDPKAVDFASALAAAQTRVAAAAGRDATVLDLEALERAIAVLASAYGEDPAAVARDLRSDTPLARLVRKMFGQAVAPKRGRGRPPSAAKKLDALVVSMFRHAGLSEMDACAETAKILGEFGRRGRGGKKPIAEEGIRTSMRRTRAGQK